MELRTRTFACLVGVVLLGAVFLVACSGDDNGDSSPAATATRPAAAATNPPSATTAPTPASGAAVVPAISMADFSYSPASLTIPVGNTTIALRNSGPSPHTFTIDNLVDVQVAAGGSGSASLSSTGGSFTFYCTIHGRASMSGTLTIAGAQ